MKNFVIAAALSLIVAAPVFAQEAQQSAQDARGYITGVGGFAASVNNTAADILIEGGVRIAPRVMVFGDVGRFSSLEADLQPTLSATAAALSTQRGLSVIGAGSVPATYASAGLRVELPVDSRVIPYVLGGAGIARLTPSATFAYGGGPMPDGSTPAIGADVTSAVATSGAFTAPPSNSVFMFTIGGGFQAAVAPHWVLDLGYRYSRLAADSSLAASPLSTNAIIVGFGYRF